jgi:hypothetical protein
MPKVNANNRITFGTSSGILEQLSRWVNQGVRNDSSPTFSNLRLTGDLFVEGSATIDGDFTILSTEIIELKDNVILINKEETGSGVTLNLGGLEIDRGTETNYQIVFQESDDTFRSGFSGSLQAIGHREDVPLNKGVGVWNDTFDRWESKTEINLDIFFNSLTNSTSSATGNIITSGGIGVSKDINLDGKMYLTGTFPNRSVVYTDVSTNDLQIQSVNIDLVPSVNVTIPANRSLVFHSTSQSITSNTSGDFTFTSSGDVYITPATGKSVVIPNQIALEFSTFSERIYTDSSNNMNVESSQDINLTPGINKRILVPVDIPVTYSNNNQTIKADTSNNLKLKAGNNIELTPGTLLNVKIPTDNGVLFGAVGTQRISSNSSSELTIQSTGDINITPSVGKDINIPSEIGIKFGGDTQSIESDTNGNLFITANTGLQKEIKLLSDTHVKSTTNTSSGITGSVHLDGGLGVVKRILTEESLIVDSNNVEALVVRKDTDVRDTFKVDNSGTGKVSISTGDGTLSNSSVEITNESGINAKSLITFFGGTFDTQSGYSIGRGSNSINSGRALTVNIPEASEYGGGVEPKFMILSNDLSKELFSIEANTGDITAFGSLALSGTQNAINATTAAIVIYGGLGVVKDIYLNGKITIDSTDINALLIRKEGDSGDIFNVDTSSDQVYISGNVIVDHTSTTAFEVRTDGATRTILSADTINERFTVDARSYVTDTTDAANVSGGSLVVSGGVGIVKKLFVGGESKMLSNLDMSNQYITNVSYPINDKDAANKEYVDLVKQGLFVKDSVIVATTTSGTLSTSFASGESIDSYVLVQGDRILVKNQTNAIENGIYRVEATGAPVRVLDFDAGDIAAGAFVFVQEGSVNKSLGWICNSSTTADSIGTDALNWTQFTGLGQVVAGDGLSKVFNTMNVNVDSFSLEIDSDTLRIRDCTIGTGLTGGSGQILQTTTDQSHVTKLGTIDIGTWQASTVQVLYGGTGQTEITAGNILFGSSGTQLSTDDNLFFDATTKNFGIGTSNNPLYKLHIQDTENAVVQIDADKLGTQSSGHPELSLTFNNKNTRGLVALSRTDNQFAGGVASGGLVIAHNNTDPTSRVQLATNQQVRLTVQQDGNIGINTTDPNYTLDVSGTLHTTGVNLFSDSTETSNLTTGSLITRGGLAVSKDTIIGGDLYLNGFGSVAPKIELGSKDVAGLNSLQFNSSGNGNDYDVSITVSGGSGSVGEGYLSMDAQIITLDSNEYTRVTATQDSDSSSTGSLRLVGGLGVLKNVNIGGYLNVESVLNNFIGKVEIVTTSSENYIGSGDGDRTASSFEPLNIGAIGSTGTVFTFHSSGSVLTDTNSLRIGGTLALPDGFAISFDGTDLNIVPENNLDGIIIGTTSNLSDLTINGTQDGQVKWNSGTSNLVIKSSSVDLIKQGETRHIQIETPESGVGYINAQTSDMTLNFGENGTAELTVQLSNTSGSSSITYTPSATSSSLVLTDNVTTTFNGPVVLGGDLQISGAQFMSITNTDNTNSKWFYLGRINTLDNSVGALEHGHTHLQVFNGTSRSANTASGLEFVGTTASGVFRGVHSHTSTTSNKPIVIVYNDTIDNFHLYVLAPTNSVSTVFVGVHNNTALELVVEGTGASPDGSESGYTGSWTKEYTTSAISNLSEYVGDITVEDSLVVADNLPIIGYNNSSTTGTRDVGILFQRYQVANDVGTGDVVSDIASELNTLVSQTTASITQVIFSGSASAVDDYYNGWWIKVISGTNVNQTRQITDYNGALRVATIASDWTTQKPILGDNVGLYNTNYTTTFYDESADTFVFGYVTSDPGRNTDIVLSRTADLQINKLTSTSTMPSTSLASGGLILSGGISISQTNNAVSPSNGGTLTTLGGASINKDLRVSSSIFVGTSTDTLVSDIQIRKTRPTVRLEQDSSSYSFIDFVEIGSTNRAGILYDGGKLVLTSNTSSTTPNVSLTGLSLDTSNNFIGIGTTTEITSQLSMVKDTFIGVNTVDTSDDGFLGLIGGGGNVGSATRGARVILSGNERTGSEGKLLLAGGDTSTNGSVCIETGTVARVLVDYSGEVYMTNTGYSNNSSTGALVLDGGISIKQSQNATSSTSGGALTVAGGASIFRDLYVEGNIIAGGTVAGGDSVLTPTLIFSNTENCAVTGYDNQRAILNGSEVQFSCTITATPIAGSENTVFEFDVPQRTVNWSSNTEMSSTIQGYTNSGDPIQLYNTTVTNVSGTTRAKVKFQSVDTSLHYLDIITRYVGA